MRAEFFLLPESLQTSLLKSYDVGQIATPFKCRFRDGTKQAAGTFKAVPKGLRINQAVAKKAIAELDSTQRAEIAAKLKVHDEASK